MKYMMMVKTADKRYEAGEPPDPRMMAAMGEYTEKMIQSGVVLDTGGLLPSSKGARVRLAKGKLTVVDGPFTEAKELIGGYAIVKAASKAEAIKLGEEFMGLHKQILGDTWDGEVEIRQLDEYDPGA
jgi:hypothetical protein